MDGKYGLLLLDCKGLCCYRWYDDSLVFGHDGKFYTTEINECHKSGIFDSIREVDLQIYQHNLLFANKKKEKRNGSKGQDYKGKVLQGLLLKHHFGKLPWCLPSPSEMRLPVSSLTLSLSLSYIHIEREREKSLPSTSLRPNWPKWLGLSQANPGAWNSMGSPQNNQRLKTPAIFHCFISTLSDNWIKIAAAGTQTGYPTWDISPILSHHQPLDGCLQFSKSAYDFNAGPPLIYWYISSVNTKEAK